MTLLHTERGDFESILEGPQDGPLVVLLHGFPELNYSWREQIPALTQAGYRVLAPNQRGYSGSEQDGSFATADLAADVVAMIDAMGAERAVVVGHDWGGGVAWTVAQLYPQRVAKLVAMNCPPPSVLKRELLTNPVQTAKSWYMFFFQIPVLPERFVSKNIARTLIAGSYNRKAWNHETLAPYVDAFSTPADARGAVSWYRGALRRARENRKPQPITAPILLVWGTQDRFLGLNMISPQALRHVVAYGNEPTIVLVEEAGHFVQSEAPELVSQALVNWLGPVG
jgi:pimeloyl-ACP methyl ester carboxylesterase